MAQYLDLILFLLLLVVGFTVGRIAERRHYRSIVKREKEMSDVLIFSNRFPPLSGNRSQALVTGSVVVSEDYFKRVVSGLQSIFGGRLRAYESLLVRARREIASVTGDLDVVAAIREHRRFGSRGVAIIRAVAQAMRARAASYTRR